jgi:hypothetical protein
MHIGLWKTQKEDQDVDRWIILKLIVLGDMGWIDLDQDRARWRALVNAVMNLRVT